MCIHTYGEKGSEMFIVEWFIIAKNIGNKVNAHQLENGRIKSDTFTLQNIMKPLRRIRVILTYRNFQQVVLSEESKVEESMPDFIFVKQTMTKTLSLCKQT